MKKLVPNVLLVLFSCGVYGQASFPIASFRELSVSVTKGNKIHVEKSGIKINLVAGGVRPRLELTNPGRYWDLSNSRFLYVTVQNQGKTAQTVEAGIGDNFWTMGGTVIPAGAEKVLKVLLLKDEKDTALAALYSGMHGHPSGFTRLWFNTSLDSVNKLVLYFPNAIPGASFVIKNIRADGSYNDNDRKALTGFVDEFGQYKYQDWPEKIHSVNDLVNADRKEKENLSGNSFSGEWDKYGGWEKGPVLHATGYFRVEKYNGKWWLIDPEGRLFWSNGINCVNANGETRIAGREAYFEKLYRDAEYKAFYSTDGSRFDFKACNLYRKYGASWKTAFAERTHLRLRNWGVNTIGNWSDPSITAMDQTAYVASVSSGQTGNISDPFADNFQEALETRIRNVFGAAGKQEWCIGLFIDNELKWKDVIANILKAEATQPAKQALQQFLLSKYGRIASMNRQWNTSYDSWDAFLTSRSSPATTVQPGLQEFFAKFADLYFTKCRNAMKNAAPNHLYLGCRFDFHAYPADTTFNWLIRIASKYCDIVSFNRYTYTSAELAPPAGYDFPIIIGEFHFGSLEQGLLHPGLKYAANQDERAALYQSFLEQAIASKFIVGAHWFQYNDQPVTGRSDGENYQIGFVTVGDIPYDNLVRKARETGEKMYRLRQ